MEPSVSDRAVSSAPPLPTPVWQACGDTGLMLDLGGLKPGFHDILCAVDDKSVLTEKARLLAQQIHDLYAKGTITGITDITPGLTSLVIQYDPALIRASHLKQWITPLISADVAPQQDEVKIWQLPVCYADEFAPDLAEISERTGLSCENIIQLHTSTIHHVAIMGFLPGLGYMTGLNEALYLPRRANPRIAVARGSVGIAMDQTVIYPLDSPGGWNLIGRMPYYLFRPEADTPLLFSAGDRVKFTAIDKLEFEACAARAQAGETPSFSTEQAG